MWRTRSKRNSRTHKSSEKLAPQKNLSMGLASTLASCKLPPSTTRKREVETLFDNPTFEVLAASRKGRGEKKRSRGQADGTPKKVRGHESPIRQERAGTRHNQRQRWRNRVRLRRNPVYHSSGEEPFRKPTAGIGARMAWQDKPRRRKRRRGTNVGRSPPSRSGTHGTANSRPSPTKWKGGSRCIAGYVGGRCSPPGKSPPPERSIRGDGL